MAHKDVGRKTYRSMQGKTVDMDMLRKRNELTPAVGNARVNARGDQLGPGGKIIKKREELVKEYYKNTNLVADDIPVKKETEETEENTVAEKSKKTSKKKVAAKGTEATPKEMEEWEEDDEGNFVPKK